jgi:hypothetical protein
MKKVVTLMMLLMFVTGTAMAGDMVGWIVDAKCGANGAKEAHAGCAKKCAESGQALVFVNDSDKKVYKVHNQDAVTDHVGHKVTVSAKADGDSLHIDSVKM